MSTPVAGTFSFDGAPKPRRGRCDHCDEEHAGVSGFVLRDSLAYAVYFADWYPHADAAWVDVILGSWAGDDPSDHVTFGCRIGAVEGEATPACSLVPAAEVRADLPIFGTKLSRDAALAHPRLEDFWALVDWLTAHDAMLHENVFHPAEF